MQSLEYTTVDRIIAKVYRDLKVEDFNESDAIERIGEALEFLKVPQVQEQSVAFLKVKNYQAEVPTGLQMVLQIARHYNWTPEEDKCKIPKEEIEEINEASDCDSCCSPNSIPLDCNGNLLFPEGLEGKGFKPYFDMQWQYIPWTTSAYYRNNFTPVRLSNNVFFNTLVCKERDLDIYQSDCCDDEYTIVGTVEKKLRFSFKESYVALAYIKNATDKDTGYPLVPDQISYVTAITYYIKWKMAEMYSWNGREGYARLAQNSERLWLKYARQAKNYMKMPKTIDEFQNLLEQSHVMIPRHKRYYGFFGKLGRSENTKYNDPDGRMRNYYYNR